MLATARTILEHSRAKEAEDKLMPISDLLALIPGGK
jgi:hypothetical protein